MIYSEWNIFKTISFNICVYLGSQNHNQDNEHTIIPKLPKVFLPLPDSFILPFLCSPFSPGNRPVCFLSVCISLHYLKFYVNGIRQYVLFFCLAFFH